jgi:hypothetical protein
MATPLMMQIKQMTVSTSSREKPSVAGLREQACGIWVRGKMHNIGL